MEKFIDFSDDKAILVNNADWLLNLNYVDFLREVGTHFSVNRMLTAECYKQRMEKGLSFLEFNYMIMQSYDFLMLNRKYDCKIELGGDDQWRNILGGIDLERGCPLRAVRGRIPQGISFLLFGLNPHCAEEVRNGDFSHPSHVHQSSMIFSPTPYWAWKRSVEPPHRQRSLP